MTASRFFPVVLAASMLFLDSAYSQPVPNAVPELAHPLPLSAVRLTGSPLKHAQDLDAAYLLRLEPDRMLAYYRERAGLKAKAPGYDGWDGDGRNLTGHIAGHYLSAVSLMYAATGDVRFKERADYLVQQFKEVQDANGNGYLGALQDGQKRFQEVSQGNIRSGGFDLNGLWSPWYTLHKTFAGLRDAYRFTGNKLALEEEIKFAAWAEGIVKPLDEAQTQKMLNTEFGGMNEVLVDLYVDTGNKRWLDLSQHFEHKAVLDPLKKREDKLGGIHANTQIPKLLGSLARYIATGDEADGTAANFFWDTVVTNHTFATGGHGKDEYFGPAGELSARIDGRTDESCNVYNMLLMTRRLFAIQPDAKYAEFQERALFNHVLGSIDPVDGRTCYMVPVGRGVQHEYQDMDHNYTCCVGTGMENHALHGDGIYFESEDKLWINLYVPSMVQWKSHDAQITAKTTFPEGDSASFQFTFAKPREFTLALRRPSWCGEGFKVSVNGKAVKSLPVPGGYVEIKRNWRSHDTVAVTLPKTLHTEALPDNKSRVALMWGPLVLSGDLGPENREGRGQTVPIFVSAQLPVSAWLKPVAGKPGEFRSEGVGRDPGHGGAEKEVDFMPFYRLHRRTYAAYWDLYTPQEWAVKAAEIAAAEARQRRLEAATVGFVQPGEMQPERDYNQQGEDTEPARTMGRPGRRGKNWFSFDMPVDPAHPTTLVATYNSDEWRTRSFDILVDGQKVGEQTVKRELPGHFYDVEYAVPAELLKDKINVTVRFQATGGNEIAALYGLRTIRSDAPR